MAENTFAISPYVYVCNDPINMIDPTGMEPNPWIMPIGGSLLQARWIPDGQPIPDGWKVIGGNDMIFLNVSLDPVSIPVYGMTPGERYYDRYGRGERAFYYSNGRPDYGAYHWYLKRNEGIRLRNAARDPAVDLITMTSVVMGIGDAYLLGEAGYYGVTSYLAARATRLAAVEATNVAAREAVELAVTNGTTTALRKVGSVLESVDDVMANPSLLEGQSYAYVRNMLQKSEGWVNSVMTKTRGADKGWVLRQVNRAGQETGKLIQYHPGSRRHFGGASYWKVSNGTSTYRFPVTN